MLKIRDAKPLFALSVLFVPWDVFVFGRDLGWGIHFPLVRFVDTVQGTQYLTVLELLQLTRYVDGASETAVLLWLIAGALTGLAAVYVVVARFTNGTTRRWEDRLVGGAFVAAAGLFVVSRALLYDFVILSDSSAIYWFTVPVGAVYTTFVGAVFYRDWFRLGAD